MYVCDVKLNTGNALDVDGALELMERMLTHSQIKLQNLSVYLNESTHLHAIEYMRHICRILLRRVHHPIKLTLNGISVRGLSPLSEEEKSKQAIPIPASAFTQGSLQPYGGMHVPSSNEGVLILVETANGPVWSIRNIPHFKLTYETKVTMPNYRKDGKVLSYQEAAEIPVNELMTGTLATTKNPSYISLQCALTDGLQNLSKSDKLKMSFSSSNEFFSFPLFSLTHDGYIQFPPTFYFFCLRGVRDCTISILDAKGVVHSVFSDCESVIIHAPFNPLTVVIATSSNPSSWRRFQVSAYRSVTLSDFSRSFLPDSKNLPSRYAAVGDALQYTGPVLFQSDTYSGKHSVISDYLINALIPFYPLSLREVNSNSFSNVSKGYPNLPESFLCAFVSGGVVVIDGLELVNLTLLRQILEIVLHGRITQPSEIVMHPQFRLLVIQSAGLEEEVLPMDFGLFFRIIDSQAFPTYDEDEVLELLMSHFTCNDQDSLQDVLKAYKEMREANEPYQRSHVFSPWDIQRLITLQRITSMSRALDIVFSLPEHPHCPDAPDPQLETDTVDQHQWTDVGSRLSNCQKAGIHILLAAETEYIARKYALAFKADDIVETIHCTSDLESFAKLRQILGKVAESGGRCILFNVDRLPLEAMWWLYQQLRMMSPYEAVLRSREKTAPFQVVATTSLSILEEIPALLRSCLVEVYISKENEENMKKSSDILGTSIIGSNYLSELEPSIIEKMSLRKIKEQGLLFSFGSKHLNDPNKQRVLYTLSSHNPLFERANEVESTQLNELFYAIASNRVTVYWGSDSVVLADCLSALLDKLVSIQGVILPISSFTKFEELMGKEEPGPLLQAVKNGKIAVLYGSENMSEDCSEKLELLEDPFTMDIVHESEGKFRISDDFRLVFLMRSETAPQMPEYVCVKKCLEMSPSERYRDSHPLIRALAGGDTNHDNVRCLEKLLVAEDRPQSTVEIGAVLYSAEETRRNLFKRTLTLMQANGQLTEEEYSIGMSVINGSIQVQPAEADSSLAKVSIGQISTVSSIPYALLSDEDQCVKEAVGRCVLTVWKHTGIPLLLCGPDWVTRRVAAILMPVHRTISCSTSLQESELFGYWDTNQPGISEIIQASLYSVAPEHDLSQYLHTLSHLPPSGRVYVPGLFIQALIAGTSVLLTHVNLLMDSLQDQLIGMLDCSQHRDLSIPALENVFSGAELWNKVHVVATCESMEEAKGLKGFTVICCDKPSEEVKQDYDSPDGMDRDVGEKAMKLQSICQMTISMVMAWEEGTSKNETIQAWREGNINTEVIQSLFSSEIDQAVNSIIASCSFIRHPITVNISLALFTAMLSGLPSLMITDSSCLAIDLFQAICQTQGFFPVYYTINSMTTPHDLFGSTSTIVPGSLQAQWSRALEGQKVVVLLTEMDKASALVQNAVNVWAEDLRGNQSRTIVKCPPQCVLICCCSSDNTLPKDLKENCLVLRIPALTEDECIGEYVRILSSCPSWTPEQEVPIAHLINHSYLMFGEDSRKLTLTHVIRARELCTVSQSLAPLIAVWLTYVCGLDDLFRRPMEALLGLNPDLHVRIRREGSRCLLSGHCDASVPSDCQSNFQEWSFTEGEARTAFKLTLALRGQRAILLYGPSPSGKTYVVQQTAAMWGRSIQRLWLTRNTLPEELLSVCKTAFSNHQWILLENVQDASEMTLKEMVPLLILNAASDCRVILTVSSASLTDIPELIRSSVLLLYCSSIASLSAIQVICQLREEPVSASLFGPSQASNVPACLRVINAGSKEAFKLEFGCEPEDHKVEELQLERRVEYDLVRQMEGLEEATEWERLRRGKEVVLRVCSCTPAALDRHTLSEVLNCMKHAVQGHLLEYVIEKLIELVIQTQTTSPLVYRLQPHPNASLLRKWSLLSHLDPSLRPSGSLKMIDQNKELESIFHLSRDDPILLELSWMLGREDWLLESVIHPELRGLFNNGLHHLSMCATTEDVQGEASALWSLQKAYLDALEVKKHLDEGKVERSDYRRANQGYETVNEMITLLPEDLQKSPEVISVQSLLKDVQDGVQAWQKEEERKKEESAYAEMLSKLEETSMDELYVAIKENCHQKNKVKPQATDNTIVKEFLPHTKGESGLDFETFDAVKSKAAHLVRTLTTKNTFASRQPYKRVNVIIDTNVTMRGTKRRLRSIVTSVVLCVLRELGVSSSLFLSCGRMKGVQVPLEGRDLKDVISLVFDVEAVVKIPSCPLDLLLANGGPTHEVPCVLISDGFSEQLLTDIEDVTDLLTTWKNKLFMLTIVGETNEALSEENQSELKMILQKHLGENQIAFLQDADGMNQCIQLLIEMTSEGSNYKIADPKSEYVAQGALSLKEVLNDKFLDAKCIVNEPPLRTSKMNAVKSYFNVKAVGDSYAPPISSKSTIVDDLNKYVPGDLEDALSKCLLQNDESSPAKIVVKKKKVKKHPTHRPYTMSIIVDASTLAFSPTNRHHALLTLFGILYNLARLNVSTVDVFVASTSVLCVAKGVGPEALWQPNIVGALYAVVSGTLPLTTALAATLREACNLCDSRKQPSTALLFTNGVLNGSERKAVQSVSNEFRGRLICFGIGSYLNGFRDLLPLMMWSADPHKLQETLMLHNKPTEVGNLFAVREAAVNESMMKKEHQRCHLALIQELLYEPTQAEVIVTQVGFTDSMSPEEYGGKKFYSSKQDELGADGAFKDHGLLVVCLYLGRDDYPKDSCVSYKQLTEGDSDEDYAPMRKLGQTTDADGNPEGKGFSIFYAYDYASALEILRKESIRVMLVFCSPGDGQLPVNDADVALCDAFIETVRYFQQHGGGVYWGLDNYPYSFEADRFFSQYYGFTAVGDPTLTLPGGEMMKRSLLDQKGCFRPLKIGLFNFSSLSTIDYGLKTIAEGSTLSELNEKSFKGAGFTWFAREHKGHATLMLLEAKGGEEGRMIVDSGASKFFMPCSRKGTARWIGNAMVWLTNMESWMDQLWLNPLATSGIDMSSFTVTVPRHLYEPRRVIGLKSSVCVSIIVDTTASMSKQLVAVKKSVESIYKSIQNSMKEKGVTDRNIVGQISPYKDYSERFACRGTGILLDFEKVQEGLDHIQFGGGSDGPMHCDCPCEDIQLGVERALDALESDEVVDMSHVLVIVGDAPQHGDNNDCKCSDKLHPVEGCSMNEVWRRLLDRIGGLRSKKVIFVPLGDGSLNHTKTQFLKVLQNGVYEMKPKEQIDLSDLVESSLADCIYKSGIM